MPITPFPTDQERGKAGWLTGFTNALFRSRYRATVGDSNAAGRCPLIIKGVPGQTADLLDIYDTNNNGLFWVDANGIAHDGGALGYATVTVTSAQILSLFTTAVPLVAAPGANKVLEFQRATISFIPATTPYTVGTATNLSIKYKDKTGIDVSTTRAVTGFIDQSTAQYSMFASVTTQLTLDANAVNQPLVLALLIANPTAGDGTFKIDIAYRTHTLV